MEIQWKSLGRIAGKAVNRLESFAADRRQEAFRAIIGPGLRPGSERRLMELHRRIGFAGKRILEIGGDLEGRVVKACLVLGAGQVTSINHDATFQSRESERSSFLFMDAGALDFPDEHFDIVIGLAVLEHIRPLEQVLANVHRVLRPGGHVYLQGGPLWFGGKGHHLILVGETGQHWRFDGRPGSKNPIEDWDHLRQDPAGLTRNLILRGCSQADAEAIVEYVNGTELINRYSATHIRHCFESSRLTILQCSQSQKRAQREIDVTDLASRYRLPEAEFRTTSIEFLASR